MQFNTPAVQRKMDLRFYWRQVCQRPWLIVTLVLVSLVLGGLKVVKTRPIYQATTKILIEQNKPQVNPFEDVIAPRQTMADYQTQFEILQSRALARRVVTHLGLRSHPEFALKTPARPRVAMQSIQSWIHSLLHVFSRSSLPDDSREDPPPPPGAKPASDTALVNAFLSRLQVKPMPRANLVDVSFQAYDAALAAKVANSLARLYIDFNMETRFAALQDALDWLERQVGGMRQQVETSEKALQQYKEKHDVYLIDDRLSSLMQEIATLDTSLTQSKTERIELETMYKELEDAIKKGKGVEWMPAVVENPLIQNLKARYIDLQHSFALLSQKYGDDHPRTVQLKAQLKDLESEIDQEVKRIVQAFKIKYQVILAREKSLQSEIGSLKREVRDLNNKSVQYGALKREAKSNQRLSELLLNRLKEASVSADLTHGNNIRIIDPAEVPTRPINVNPSRTIGVAGLLGLLGGLGLVALMGYLDNTLKTPEEAEEFLDLPVLGMIEQYRQQQGQAHEALITLAQPQGKITEAFKTLRANLLLSYTDPPRKVFLITSPHARDGKTTIATNLAVVMAQTERRVLLVDADLRNPSVHDVFNIDNREGLRERLLTETYDLTTAASGPDLPFDGLSIITAGEEVPNPSELLESKRMERFLAYAREHYDVVIIDSPPVLAVSDALVLSPLVDGIVVVLRAGATPYNHAQYAVSSFLTLYAETLPPEDQNPAPAAPAASLGLVMNCIDPHEGGAYIYHGYHRYSSAAFSES
jgi:succinoglycan biosynthesis transport protein ExoP